MKIEFQVDSELRDSLAQQAEREDLTISGLIRKILQAYLSKSGKVAVAKNKDIVITEQLIEELCSRLLSYDVEGFPRTISNICLDPDMPSYPQLTKWLAGNLPINRMLNEEITKAYKYQAPLFLDLLVRTLQDKSSRMTDVEKVVRFITSVYDPEKFSSDNKKGKGSGSGVVQNFNFTVVRTEDKQLSSTQAPVQIPDAVLIDA